MARAAPHGPSRTLGAVGTAHEIGNAYTRLMDTASRIRSFRVRAGKSKLELSERLGLNAAWYDDLEHDDHALVSTLTLFQAIDLASVLGVGLHELVTDRPAPEERVPLAELPERIHDHIAREGISLENFEDQVGWTLGDFIESPLTVTAEHPVEFLQALSANLGIDWLALIPDEDPAA
jgi:transcriptional regulator with XRE-family HTH domain